MDVDMPLRYIQEEFRYESQHITVTPAIPGGGHSAPAADHPPMLISCPIDYRESTYLSSW